jgi:hypothetical protein
MADATNVVPIKPTPRKRARGPADFHKHAKTVLHEHQSRVYEALAVAKLLATRVDDAILGSLTVEDLDVQLRATHAIIRLLSPVEGLYDVDDLIAQGKVSGLVPSDEVTHG